MSVVRPAAGALVLIAAVLFGGACSSSRFGDVEGQQGAVDAGGGGPGENDASPDSGVMEPDAAGPEPSEPRQVTLTQSVSKNIVGATAIACPQAVNSFYRVLPLSQFSITGPVDVTSVTFGIEEAVSGDGSQPATVLLHTLQGGLDAESNFQLAGLTRLTSVNTEIEDVAFPGDGQLGGEFQTVPIAASVPAGATLVVEVTHPALGNGEILLMGSNAAGESGKTYLRAPACGTNQPTKAEEIRNEDTGQLANMHWVVEVVGTTPR